MKPSSPTIILLVGPSCSGKTTLEKALVQKGAAAVISNTTRPQRSGEENGTHYHFRSVEWFEKTKAADEFVELVEFSGNQYGNTLTDLKDAFRKSQNGIVVWVVEPQGLKQIKKYFETNDLSVFLYAAFVDGDEDKRLERFAGRVIADIDGQRSLHAVKAELQRAFGRVKSMMTTERTWVQEANESMEYDAGLYNCIIKKFDESNQNDIVEFLCNITAIRRFSNEVAKAASEGLLHENKEKLSKASENARREAIMDSERASNPKETTDASDYYSAYRQIFGFDPTCDVGKRLASNLAKTLKAKSKSSPVCPKASAQSESGHTSDAGEGSTVRGAISEKGQMHYSFKPFEESTSTFESQLRLLGIPYQIVRVNSSPVIRTVKPS